MVGSTLYYLYIMTIMSNHKNKQMIQITSLSQCLLIIICEKWYNSNKSTIGASVHAYINIISFTFLFNTILLKCKKHNTKLGFIYSTRYVKFLI